MLGKIIRFLRKRARARITAKLDALYADMRDAEDCTNRAKASIDSHYHNYVVKMERKEKALIAKAKRIDKYENKRAISSTLTRAYP